MTAAAYDLLWVTLPILVLALVASIPGNVPPSIVCDFLAFLKPVKRSVLASFLAVSLPKASNERSIIIGTLNATDCCLIDHIDREKEAT